MKPCISLIEVIGSFSMEENSFNHNSLSQQDAAIEMELPHHFIWGDENEVQQAANGCDLQRTSNFNTETSYLHHQNSVFADHPQSLLPYSSVNFLNSAQNSPSLLPMASYDHPTLNVPLSQPPFLREMFHSLPNTGLVAGSPRNGSLFENGVFEFNGGGKPSKPFVTERHRRVRLNDMFEGLKKLVPNPTKNDRASTVANAIDYIDELKRTVTELKVLVEKKKFTKERHKRHKSENESKIIGDVNQENGSLRCSWLQRKSKNTIIDVKIIDDEVTVKLVQQKRSNCLMFVSKVLHELQLDLHHVAGGLIGDYYTFFFNSKIYEGSTVYASALANKLIEAVDHQSAATDPPPDSY